METTALQPLWDMMGMASDLAQYINESRNFTRMLTVMGIDPLGDLENHLLRPRRSTARSKLEINQEREVDNWMGSSSLILALMCAPLLAPNCQQKKQEKILDLLSMLSTSLLPSRFDLDINGEPVPGCHFCVQQDNNIKVKSKS